MPKTDVANDTQPVRGAFDTVARVSGLLAERGMSAGELARLSGINASTFRAAASRGTQLSLTTVEQICAALDISLSFFFTEKEENSSAKPE